MGSFIYDAVELVGMALKIKPDRNKTIQNSIEILKTTNINTMETTNFFSSVATLNIANRLFFVTELFPLRNDRKQVFFHNLENFITQPLKVA